MKVLIYVSQKFNCLSIQSKQSISAEQWGNYGYFNSEYLTIHFCPFHTDIGIFCFWLKT